MMFKKYFLWLIVLLVVSNHLFGDTGDTKVTIKVIGEDDQPIEDAEVKVTFQRQLAKSITEKGVTDKEGLFSAEGVSEAGHISYSAKKEGYYLTLAKIFISSINNKDPELKNGKWQPWNPVIPIVIKKKINPVPMFAKRVNLKFPELNKPVGFDFEKGDWVAPHGKGITSDMTIKFEGYFKDGNNWQRDGYLVFKNKKDGIQSYIIKDFERFYPMYGSELKMPHIAPEKGYQNTFTLLSKRENGKIIQNFEQADGQCYFFRIRSKVNEKGEVTEALYGKIVSKIEVFPREPNIHFVYYLNPDGTRNVEFDPKKNLFIKTFKDKMNVDYCVTQP